MTGESDHEAEAPTAEVISEREVRVRRVLGSGWVADSIVRASSGRLDIVDVHVRNESAGEPPEGLSAALLREAVRVRDVLEAAREALQEAGTPGLRLGIAGLAEAAASSGREVELALTALVYEAALEAGVPAPNREVAVLMGTDTVRATRNIFHARQRGYLSSAGGRGVAGGSLTPEGARLVEGVIAGLAQDGSLLVRTANGFLPARGLRTPRLGRGRHG